MVTPVWWQEETTTAAAVRWSGLLGRLALLAIAMSMLWLGVGAQAATAAAQLPAGFSDELVVGNLNRPTTVPWAGGGRMFIAERAGVVHVHQGGTLTEFIDISSEVNNARDRGLLGLTVHPDFPTTPHVYLLYVYDPPETQSLSGDGGPNGGGARVCSRLVRYEADPAQNYNVALADTSTVLLGANSTWQNIGEIRSLAARLSRLRAK